MFCWIVALKRNVYGAFARMPFVAAFTMKNGILAAVDTRSTAIADGVNKPPTKKST